MAKYLNLPDVLLITFSAYVVIWGINHFLRGAGMADYQA